MHLVKPGLLLLDAILTGWCIHFSSFWNTANHPAQAHCVQHPNLCCLLLTKVCNSYYVQEIEKLSIQTKVLGSAREMISGRYTEYIG